MTPNILKAINGKNNFYREVIKQPQDAALKKQYSKCRNSFQKLIKSTEKHYVTNYVSVNELKQGLFGSASKISVVDPDLKRKLK